MKELWATQIRNNEGYKKEAAKHPPARTRSVDELKKDITGILQDTINKKQEASNEKEAAKHPLARTRSFDELKKDIRGILRETVNNRNKNNIANSSSKKSSEGCFK
jgi:DNA-binding HxlR family transcriptional regulator